MNLGLVPASDWFLSDACQAWDGSLTSSAGRVGGAFATSEAAKGWEELCAARANTWEAWVVLTERPHSAGAPIAAAPLAGSARRASDRGRTLRSGSTR